MYLIQTTKSHKVNNMKKVVKEKKRNLLTNSSVAYINE